MYSLTCLLEQQEQQQQQEKNNKTTEKKYKKPSYLFWLLKFTSAIKTEIYEDTEWTTDVFSMVANTPPTSLGY